MKSTEKIRYQIMQTATLKSYREEDSTTKGNKRDGRKVVAFFSTKALQKEESLPYKMCINVSIVIDIH